MPPHDRKDETQRRAALEAYHQHIIEIAEHEGHPELADLERAARDSGIDEIGDFKLSCSDYEELLIAEGFRFEKEKIGPLNRDDVGGIYVYTIRMR